MTGLADAAASSGVMGVRLVAVLAAGADPMAPSEGAPRLLDSGQFAVVSIGMALCVLLLGIIAVGQWRR